MSQNLLFKDMPLKPDLSLGEPVIWIKRIVLLKSLEDEEPIRDILFRLGVNIIATEQAQSDDQKVIGHDVGKTLLMRMIRYCLGEEHYCDSEIRTLIANQLPDSYILAQVRINGETWGIARPIGILPSRSHSWSNITDDIQSLRSRENNRNYNDCLEAINKATEKCFADIGLRHADHRNARWQDLLGWISRDQDCLFHHHAQWRVTESQAGPRVLNKEDSYMIMRMAMGLIREEEIRGTKELDQLRLTFTQQQARSEKLDAILEQTENDIKDWFNDSQPDTGNIHCGGLLESTVARLADKQIVSLSALLADILEDPDIKNNQQQLNQAMLKHGALESQIKALEANIETRKITLSRYDEEDWLMTIGDSGFPCKYWPGDKEAAIKAGCPGESYDTKDSAKDPRKEANIRFLKNGIEQDENSRQEHQGELQKVKSDISEYQKTLRANLSQQFKTRQGISEEIGRWREIKQRAVQYNRLWNEWECLKNTLENRDSTLRKAREELATMRQEINDDLAKLSQCYRAILRIVVSPDADGEVVIDGNGIRPKVTHVSSSGTTLKTCAHVLSYDFACLMASICGVGYLPRIWMHDSPRAADTEDSLYYRLMSVCCELEKMFGKNQPGFQYIWSTTSMPPEDLNNDTFVRLRLNGRTDLGKLLKCTFGK